MSDFANQGGEFSGGLPENPANRLFKSVDLQPVGEITMEYLLRRIEALEKELAKYRALYGPLPPE
jgi:hypothetical protein